MNVKNKKLQQLSLVLLIAGLLAGSLLRANDEGAAEEVVKPSQEKSQGQAAEPAPEESQEETDKPAPEKSQEQVLQELLDKSSPGPMIITHEISDKITVPVVEPVDPRAKLPLLLRDGDWLSNRLGRLAKDTKGRLLFVYEADAAHLSEPPLILLPCLKLEQMELLVAKRPNAKLTITGEVTVYHGKGYLLLRKVMLQRDMGQF